MKASDYILYLVMLLALSMPGLGKNIHRQGKFPMRSFEKTEYLIWLYLLLIDLAVYLFMHLLNTYLLCTSIVY